MSTVSSNSTPPVAGTKKELHLPQVPWNPWLAVVFVVAVYYVSQIVGGALLALYAGAHHWTSTYTQYWLSNSVAAQFVYVAIAEGLTLYALYMFMRRYKFNFHKLGLRRLQWRDPLYALVAVPVYYGIALVVFAVVRALVPDLNFNETQEIGFESAKGVAPLILTYISLAILPPFTEEIMVRGFLYGSLKKGMSLIWAVVITSIIFAAAHLGEGAKGLLWTAAIQFFILSAVLIYLREKTQSLWAPIFLHAINNSIAFISLFLLH